MHREKIDRLLDTYARSRPGTQREQTWLWDRLEALSVWESAALAASLIPEESAPDSGSVFQFNWAFLLVPLGVTALAGGGMGTALFLKRRHESEEGTE